MADQYCLELIDLIMICSRDNEVHTFKTIPVRELDEHPCKFELQRQVTINIADMHDFARFRAMAVTIEAFVVSQFRQWEWISKTILTKWELAS